MDVLFDIPLLDHGFTKKFFVVLFCIDFNNPDLPPSGKFGYSLIFVIPKVKPTELGSKVKALVLLICGTRIGTNER
jgi:hypothetical protein